MSYTNLIYHVIFSPKNRERVLSPNVQRSIYHLLYRQILRHEGKVYRINGVEDHIHMLFSLPPTRALSEVMKVTKQETSKTISRENIIPNWVGWQDGFGGFTVSYWDKDKVIDYIIKQEEHHKTVTFMDEYRQLLRENGLEDDLPWLKL